MADRKILLSIIFDNFDGLRLDDFPNRLKLQKRMYLMQLFGLDLGYRFNWYIHGPYCPTLADDAFELVQRPDIVRTGSSEFELSEKAKSLLKKYKSLEKRLSTYELIKSLELAASIHYLKNIGFIPGGATKTNIRRALRSKGKNFAENEIQNAWDSLKAFNLI